MMHVYIYPLAPSRCDCYDPYHLRLAMPNFCRESKVTSHQISTIALSWCDCHNTYHLRLAMPNFCRESKVTSHQISVVEIWHFAQMT